MTTAIVIDVGGTHARFATAEVSPGAVLSLSEEVVLKTAEHASIETAWATYVAALQIKPPRHAAIAFAGPVGGEVLTLTNSHWVVRPAILRERFGLDDLIVINDFGAVAHAVAHLPASNLHHVCGPDQPLPAEGVTSIIGPGTGLGVALLVRRGAQYQVVETEGGHVDFAPLDSLEDGILAALREKYRRVSAERIASGPGLRNIYTELARIEGHVPGLSQDATLWEAALAGSDRLALAALDRFCMSLGSITGDIALAQGATSVVVAGGIGLRLAPRLPQSGFVQRFVSKGRFERHMSAMPVKVVTHPQPGLFGAAAAFAATVQR